MATYYGNGRSNYFYVKDAEKFKEWLTKFEGAFKLIERETEDDDMGFALLARMDSGMLPDMDDDGNSVDFEGEIAEMLQPIDGNCFIWTEAGSEGDRYVGGSALAVHHTGQMTYVSTHQIYEKVEKEFGTRPLTLAEY